MLALNITRPSHSAWGGWGLEAPCILVQKPLEKGLPQPRPEVYSHNVSPVSGVGSFYAL